MARGRPTRFGEISSLAYPANAPLVIRFAPAMEHMFEKLRRASFPSGRSMERGATIVADAQGVLSLQHIGGRASTYKDFTPDLSASPPARYKVVGTFHTHPYDTGEHSYNGVSLSGGDAAALILTRLTISVVQSGPRLFAYVRTARTPGTADFTKMNDQANEEAYQLQRGGRTFQQATRLVAQRNAERLGLAYYQGLNGVLSRVSP